MATKKSEEKPDLTVVTDTTEPPKPPYERKHDRVNIVGFAPSWKDTPWDDEDADLWGMNALHKVAADKNWDAWFQLHDIKKNHSDDLEEHLEFLSSGDFTVFLWEKEAEKYPQIENVAVYPREDMMNVFGGYFTNTVSWMMAIAIALGYKEIGIYGIDMAQSGGIAGSREYQNQRPSCEYFIGWAKGMGIEVFIPDTSDLLKAPFLYGYDDSSMIRKKMEGRLKELQERAQGITQQRDQAQAGVFQIQGAIEDLQYWMTNWVHENETMGKKK